MLTIFTIPKTNEGHIGIIQRNATASWLQLRPKCEIILCGNDPGVAELAAEYGTKHISNIARNEYGTPFLSSAFERVLSVAENRFICYANADIIFFSDLLSCLQRITFPRFLMAGQRWNLDVTAPICFDEPDWEQRLKAEALIRGTRDVPGAIDYFVFQTGTVGKLPDFVVGRPRWDNWFIRQFRVSGMPVIDATRANMVLHQNHSYGHVPQRRDGTKWEGPEADYHSTLMGNEELLYTLLDSTHMLTDKTLLPAVEYKYLRRRIVRFFYRSKALFRLLRPFARLVDTAMTKLRF